MSTAFDPAAFPLVERGNRYDDFAVGRVFHHRWRRTLTETDNILFSTATCHWSPRSLDATRGDYQINPLLLLCTVVGLSVEDLSELGGPFLGIDDCRFGVTVLPGDTVRASSEVLDRRRSKSRADSGIVTWRTTARNQRDDIVLELVRCNLVTI